MLRFLLTVTPFIGKAKAMGARAQAGQSGPFDAVGMLLACKTGSVLDGEKLPAEEAQRQINGRVELGLGATERSLLPRALERGVGPPDQPVVEATPPRTPRAGTKLAKLVALLGQEGGATIEELAAATSWQVHTVRGVLSGALVRRFGLMIVSEKIDGRGRTYRARSKCHDDQA